MMPDELLRLDNRKEIILLRGQKPLELFKIAPEELPSYQNLIFTPVTDYVPEWRKREKQGQSIPQGALVHPPKASEKESPAPDFTAEPLPSPLTRFQSKVISQRKFSSNLPNRNERNERQ